MKIVTMARLQRAYDDVKAEHRRLGIWTERINDVDVRLVPLGFSALGWKWDGPHGCIDIPAISLARLARNYLDLGAYHSLRHVLRHEIAHGFADVHASHVHRIEGFSATFGGRYSDISKPYAGRPCERFADAFAVYVRATSRHPNAKTCVGVTYKEWLFIRRLVRGLRLLNRRAS